MPRILFHPAARIELLQARKWYDAQRAGLGEDLARTVDAAISRIGKHPDLYPEVEVGVRRAALPRFPYGRFYRVELDTIRILALFHHRRDPSVWRGRADF